MSARCITSLAKHFEPRICRSVDAGLAGERTSDRAFAGVSALLFAVSAAVTIVWCASMAAMRGMAMPGGWTMSMAWMRLPGKTWLESAASFSGMWIAMMAAMMVPSLAPVLRRYRRSVLTGDNVPHIVRHLHHTCGAGALQCFLVGSLRLMKHNP